VFLVFNSIYIRALKLSWNIPNTFLAWDFSWTMVHSSYALICCYQKSKRAIPVIKGKLTLYLSWYFALCKSYVDACDGGADRCSCLADHGLRALLTLADCRLATGLCCHCYFGPTCRLQSATAFCVSTTCLSPRLFKKLQLQTSSLCDTPQVCSRTPTPLPLV
jgi:hypothetical protein